MSISDYIDHIHLFYLIMKLYLICNYGVLGSAGPFVFCFVEAGPNAEHGWFFDRLDCGIGA